MHLAVGFIQSAVQVLIALAVYEYIRSHRGYKYKWTCPKCHNFHASANTQDIIDRVKEAHADCEGN